MPKYLVNRGGVVTPDGQVYDTGATVELTEEQASRYLRAHKIVLAAKVTKMDAEAPTKKATK